MSIAEPYFGANDHWTVRQFVSNCISSVEVKNAVFAIRPSKDTFILNRLPKENYVLLN